MTRILLLLLSLFFTLSLTSCASMTPAAAKRAYCNQLKSNLVFNGSTGITRTANIEESNTPLDQRSYDEADCDKYSHIN